MEALGNGLVLMLNGLLTMVGWAASGPAVLGLAVVVSFVYLAHIEVAELDRSTAKPDVELH